MFDDLFRRLKDRWLAPVARWLGPGIAPDHVTWAACAVGLACAVAAGTGHVTLAAALWGLNRLLDGLDGTQARMHGRASAYGGYLDIVLDFVVYAAVPTGLAFRLGTAEAFCAALLLLASFYVNAGSWIYLAAVLEQRREGAAARGELTTVTMPAGIVAGTETVLVYTVFLLLPQRAPLLFTVMALLVFVNVALRLVWAKRSLG